jgi:hypothetical protein
MSRAGHGISPPWPLDHALVPRLNVREPLKLLLLFLLSGTLKGHVEAIVPGDEGQVREADAVTLCYKPFSVIDELKKCLKHTYVVCVVDVNPTRPRRVARCW